MAKSTQGGLGRSSPSLQQLGACWSTESSPRRSGMPSGKFHPYIHATSQIPAERHPRLEGFGKRGFLPDPDECSMFAWLFLSSLNRAGS